MILMDHKVLDVGKLHTSASNLYNNVVVGGSNSADSILNNLNQGIENLKANWKGKDAGVRIQELIRVYNGMVEIRNALAQLAVDSSMVAVMYRKIQNQNSAGLEELSLIHFEPKSPVSDYSDNADTIDINSMAEAGKRYVDTANSSIEPFVAAVKAKYQEIMENWLAGPKRGDCESAFNTFINASSGYIQVLTDVSSNITNALQNYTF